MRTRLFATMVVLACSVAAVGQTRNWTPPRTSDGQIDLEGVWDFSTITPLERPNGLDKATFTDQEAANFEREAFRNLIEHPGRRPICAMERGVC